jgi:peptidoglycan/LPS O-acetylase OafA/YrhL
MTANADLAWPQRRILALDGVRALAVLGVLFAHLGYPVFNGAGTLGVFAFFTISGFIITHLLILEYERTGTINLRLFWLRRAARLLPPVAILVVGVSVARRFVSGTAFADSLPQAVPTALYYANWVRVWSHLEDKPARLGNYAHTWSLAVEEQFYILWPLILLALFAIAAATKRAWMLTAIVALCVASATVRPFGFNTELTYRSSEALYNRTDAMAELLLAGACVAVLAWMHRSGELHWPLRSPLLGWASVAVVASAFVLMPGYDQPNAMLVFWTVGITAIAWANAALCWHLLQSQGSLLSRTLALTPLVAIGRISYGVYLYHYPIYRMLRPELPLPWWAADAAVVALSLSVAALSWRYVEQPAVRWARRRTRARDAKHLKDTEPEPAFVRAQP